VFRALPAGNRQEATTANRSPSVFARNAWPLVFTPNRIARSQRLVKAAPWNVSATTNSIESCHDVVTTTGERVDFPDLSCLDSRAPMVALTISRPAISASR
jgi:hypothetical protein